MDLSQNLSPMLLQQALLCISITKLIERATERVNQETLKNLNNLRNTLNDLANLTGQTTPEFVNRTEGRFQNYFEPAAQRGFNLLTEAPKQFGTQIAAIY